MTKWFNTPMNKMIMMIMGRHQLCAPSPGSLRPNELSDVEEKAHYLPIATFYKFNLGKSSFKIQSKGRPTQWVDPSPTFWAVSCDFYCFNWHILSCFSIS